MGVGRSQALLALVDAHSEELGTQRSWGFEGEGRTVAPLP